MDEEYGENGVVDRKENVKHTIRHNRTVRGGRGE
jgi:hypothetical protein